MNYVIRIFRMAETDFEGYEVLRDLLPDDHDYKVINCEVEDQSESNLKFMLEMRVNVKSELDVKQFLSALNTSSGCTFNIKNGQPEKDKVGVGLCHRYVVTGSAV